MATDPQPALCLKCTRAISAYLDELLARLDVLEREQNEQRALVGLPPLRPLKVVRGGKRGDDA